MDKLTVAEAAERLNISQDAVRQRIRRGTIEHAKDGDGRVYVFLIPTNTAHDTVHDGVHDAVHDGVHDALVEELRERVRFLEAELEDRKEEARRKDTIIMTMTQRIPELEPAKDPSPKPRESPETASVGAEGVEVPFEEKQRSWWRRFFDL